MPLHRGNANWPCAMARLEFRRVRTELESLLEGGRPRPPFSSARGRTRTSALQKIPKLLADHLTFAAPNGARQSQEFVGGRSSSTAVFEFAEADEDVRPPRSSQARRGPCMGRVWPLTIHRSSIFAFLAAAVFGCAGLFAQVQAGPGRQVEQPPALNPDSFYGKEPTEGVYVRDSAGAVEKLALAQKMEPV